MLHTQLVVDMVRRGVVMVSMVNILCVAHTIGGGHGEEGDGDDGHGKHSVCVAHTTRRQISS